jgi:DNA-binding transcriptional ArsR family regulator
MQMDVLEDVAALFKLLSHPARLAILQVLQEGEECVCHVVAALGLRQAYISQQLMVLRQAGLVTDRREGWNVFYRTTRPEIYAVLSAALATVTDTDANAVRTRPQRCTCPKCAVGVLN